MAQPTFGVVTDKEHACANIRRFEKELGREKNLADIMSYGRAWYACKAANGWLMAPSKFVGYADNDAQTYLATHRERDGRITERVLSQWFEEVAPGTTIYEEMHIILRQLFARFGKTPNKSLRINVLKTDLGPTAVPRPRAKADKMASRITVDAQVCGGRPCIRGMRIRVSDILDLLAAGNGRATILSDYPYLEDEDIDAALEYASDAINHRIVKAA